MARTSSVSNLGVPENERMTEAEWLAAERPSQLLRYLHKTTATSDRKFRLFAVACCRRVAEQIPDIALTEVIGRCEHLSEVLNVEDWKTTHLKKLGELREVVDRSQAALHTAGVDDDIEHHEFAFAVSALTTFPIHPEECVDSCMSALCGHDDYITGRGEVLFQVDLLHDIFCNPFRPINLSPAWLTTKVVELAQQIYDERAFDRLPTLANALEEAGCTNPEILSHCRGPGPHVRGCWVVDLLLGKK